MFINQNKYQNHIYFMRLALEQAKKTIGNTKKNPAVGCIITKFNQVIGAGCTSINGKPHAELNAVNFSKNILKNSQLYVTLEPCSHYGKTPPCVMVIIRKKIKKVFFSIKDPDPRSFNKSSKLLCSNGITVNKGLLKNEMEFFYRSYLKFKKRDLPFVTCKLAISKDFYTINKRKDKWITNEFSRARVHLMRSNHDCIMTSSKTIVNDNPRLTCRIDGLKDRSPSRIILDNKLKISINSKIIKEANNFNTIVFFNKTNIKKIKLLKKLNIKIFKISLDNNGQLDLIKSLRKAKQLGFSRIFLESGIKLASSFLKKNLIDDLKLFMSNNNLRKNGSSNFKKCFQFFLKNKKKTIEKVNLLGDKLISYKLK